MLKQLYYGSLQDHMRTSRREMNQSYALQQQQLMRMNIMRESQRMMLTQAETLVRMNQIRDEVIKALPPKNNTVEEQRYAGILQAPPVIPTSNAALEETLSSSKEPQTQVTMEEEVEGKRAPPRNLKVSTSNSHQESLLEAVKRKLSPSQVMAEAKAKADKVAAILNHVETEARSSHDKAIKAAAKVASDSEPITVLKQKLNDLKAQVKIIEEKRITGGIHIPNNISNSRSILSSGNSDKVETLEAAIARAEAFIEKVRTALEIEAKIAAAKEANPDLKYDVIKPAGSGDGLKRLRAKSGRFVKSKR